jgi:hypothetical protein
LSFAAVAVTTLTNELSEVINVGVGVGVATAIGVGVGSLPARRAVGVNEGLGTGIGAGRVAIEAAVGVNDLTAGWDDGVAVPVSELESPVISAVAT